MICTVFVNIKLNVFWYYHGTTFLLFFLVTILGRAPENRILWMYVSIIYNCLVYFALWVLRFWGWPA